MEQFTAKGKWYIPELKDKVSLDGIITYSPNSGIKLDVLVSFKESLSTKEHQKLIEPELIHGTLESGEHITLYKCFSTKIPIWNGSSIEYIVNYGFIGGLLNENSLTFTRFDTSFNLLNNWFVPKALNVTYENSIKIRNVLFPDPESYEFPVNKGKLTLWNSWKSNYTFSQKFEAKSVTGLSFSFDEEVDLQELLITVYQLQIFFSLISGWNFYPQFLRAKTEREEVVDVLYSFNIGEDYDKDISWHELLFNFRILQESFGEKIEEYFESLEKLQIVYDLFYEYRFRKSIVEDKFINIARALEVYHRKSFNENSLSEWLIELLLEEIKKSVRLKIKEEKLNKREIDEVERFISRIKYFNEPPLFKRLKDLYRLLRNIDFIKQLFGGNKRKVNSFLRRVYVSRNYYVHFNPDLEKDAFKGLELYWVNKKIGTFLEALLLKGIGFTDSELNTAFTNNLKYQQLAR
ncbi:HEPN domain-containing protein [Desulfurobacterium atlanticum]|uniref:Uncharacterized protein n=1 Tax=Desulfurobacterium atlanticum TaxID=240169 RepID=A0A238Y636_9BACT|nr:HEPN domain-containing protein [Desulfurobacterium atlanticum]SNR66480.1 hypothetical protein SAMN06265340_102142 [Desulfurobacterium atlanticum]